MAFIKDKTTSANAAVMTAGQVVSSLIEAGKVTTVAKAIEAINEVFEAAFDLAAPVVEADNALFAAAEEAAPKRTATKTATKSGGSKGGGGDISVSKARALELNSGPFKGLTMGEVYDMDAADAAGYEYERGAGADYIKWLSGSRNPNDFTRKFAKALLDGLKSDEDGDE